MATGRKTVTVGQVIDPVVWGNPLWDQSVQEFADAASRTAQFPAPLKGAVTWLDAPGVLQVWDGAAWRSVLGQAAGFGFRGADLTIGPGVFGDVSGVVTGYPLRAGVQYRVNGTGIGSVGGASTDVTSRIRVTQAVGGVVTAWALTQTLAPGLKTPIVNQLIFTAANTTTADIALEATANAPATGLIMYAGSTVTIGVSG